MANLSNAEILKPGRGRVDLLVNKVFKLKENNEAFATPKGVFKATGIIIEEWEYTRGTNPTSNRTYATKAIKEIKYFSRGLSRLEVVGKYVGKSTVHYLSMGMLTKSAEFGGTAGAGAKINKGIQFETDLQVSLQSALGRGKKKGKYPESAAAIIERIANDINTPKDSEILGGQNQPRPIEGGANNIYVAPSSHRQHGSKLTDIDLNLVGGKKGHLSLKFGGTLTFVNSGVGRIFQQREIIDNNITTPLGRAIINMLGLDEQKFCDIFNLFGKEKISDHEEKVTVNRTMLIKFLQTAIGSDYYMVHGLEGKRVNFWYMNPLKNKAMATPTSDITAYYGGTSGMGKRLDVVFSNRYFDFKLNIRNKQSGLYPSHIMLDYVSKDALGKMHLAN